MFLLWSLWAALLVVLCWVIVLCNAAAEPVVEEERLRAGFAQPGEDKAEGDVIPHFSFLVGADGEDIFSGVKNGKTKGSAHRSQQGRSWLERKKELVTLRAARHWHRCPEMLLHTLKLSKT